MSDKIIRVASYNSVEEAHLVKNLLENEGVRAVVLEENNFGLFQIGPAFGGAGVHVTEDQVEHACQVLQRHEDHEQETSTQISERPLGGPGSGDQPETQITEKPPADYVTSVEEAEEEEKDEIEEGPDTPDEPEIEASAGEVMATRAFRSAVAGLLVTPLGAFSPFFLFGLFFFGFSCLMLARLLAWPGELSSAGTRRAAVAIVFDALTIAFFIAVLRVI
jgi:hypothetical protein